LKQIITFLLLYLAFLLNAQVTLIVDKLPANTPTTDDIYIAGTMNGWNPGDNNFKLDLLQDSTYSINFTPSVGQVKFKFTRGSWQKVEGTSSGTFRPDRLLNYSGAPITVRLAIDGWEDISVGSTASDQVSILSDTFYMPELNRQRRIWLYLPKDYNTSNKTYNVLYMHDGQNLFDRFRSFAGEWKVDESLDSLVANGDDGCIVVGIENGGSQRIHEYSPWVHPQYGGGGGDAYVDFIAKTLKPYMDANYRTKPEADHTGIMGSSLGGLISYYAAMKYPEVFGRVGVFSPSFWFSTLSKDLARDTELPNHTLMYMIMGDKEGERFVNDVREVSESLLRNGLDESQLYTEIHPDGEHKEWYWSREFPKAYKWLFEKKTSSISEIEKSLSFIDVSYSEGTLKVKNTSNKNFNLQIVNVQGRILYSGLMSDYECDVSIYLPPAIYFYRVYMGGYYYCSSFLAAY